MNSSLQRMNQSRSLLLLLATLLLSASCWASRISGSVVGFQHLENPVWAKAKQPGERGYSFREVVPTVPAKYRKLYPAIEKELCIVALSKNQQPKMKDVVVNIGGGRATPVTLAVTPGTKLIFKNRDPFKHRLYGVGINTFTPADSEQGSTREWTVPNAGHYEIRDERAPSLRVWVVAEEGVVSTTYPKPSGSFELSIKRAGAYELQAYFSGKKVGDAQVAQLKGKRLQLKPLVVAKAKPEKKK